MSSDLEGRLRVYAKGPEEPYTLADAKADMRLVLARAEELRDADPTRDEPEVKENWEGLIGALQRFLQEES